MSDENAVVNHGGEALIRKKRASVDTEVLKHRTGGDEADEADVGQRQAELGAAGGNLDKLASEVGALAEDLLDVNAVVLSVDVHGTDPHGNQAV